MFVTAEVSKLVTSSDAREEHPENMPYMSVTAEVLNDERSSDFNFPQL